MGIPNRCHPCTEAPHQQLNSDGNLGCCAALGIVGWDDESARFPLVADATTLADSEAVEPSKAELRSDNRFSAALSCRATLFQ